MLINGQIIHYSLWFSLVPHIFVDHPPFSYNWKVPGHILSSQEWQECLPLYSVLLTHLHIFVQTLSFFLACDSVTRYHKLQCRLRCHLALITTFTSCECACMQFSYISIFKSWFLIFISPSPGSRVCVEESTLCRGHPRSPLWLAPKFYTKVRAEIEVVVTPYLTALASSSAHLHFKCS